MTSPQSPSALLTYAEALSAASAAAESASTANLPLAMTARMADGVIAVRERAAQWAKKVIGALWQRVDPYDGNAVQDFTIAAVQHMATAQTATARAAAAGQVQILRTMGVSVRVDPSNPLDVRGSSLAITSNGAQVQRQNTRVSYESGAVRVDAADMTTQAVLNRPARAYRYMRTEGATTEQAREESVRRLHTLIDDNLMLAQRIAETEVLAAAAAPARRRDDPLDVLERELATTPRREFWTTTEETFADDEEAVPEPVDLDTDPVPETQVIIGYRRIIHPELSAGGTCGMCIVASDRLYSIGTLKPIHHLCKCTVAAVTEDHDPGMRLNRGDLARLYEEGGGTSRRHLKRTRYTIDANGELAAVLVPKAAYRPRTADSTDSQRRRTTRKRRTKADRTSPSTAASAPPPNKPPPRNPRAAADGPDRDKYRSQDRRTRIADSRFAEPLGDVLDARDADGLPDEAVARQLAEDLSGRYRTHAVDFDDVSFTPLGLRLRGAVWADDGRRAGNIERFFTRDNDGNVVVHNSYIGLEEWAQGTGFSTELYAQMRQYYARSEVDRIEVHAAIDQGGYAWAREDFSWTPRHLERSIDNVLQRMIRVANDPGTPEADRRTVNEMLSRMDPDHPDLPRPKEIADLKGVDWRPDPTKNNKDNPSLGYKLLGGASWFGTYYLRNREM